MNVLDVVHTVLSEAGQPLRHRDITHDIIELGEGTEEE